MNVKYWKKLLMGSEELAQYKHSKVFIEGIRVGE